MNGWIAVGEVVLNRVLSDAFPNSIPDVIYDEGQFTDSEELSSTEPTDEMISVAQMVLSGKLKVLNRSDILYFRNPYPQEGEPAQTPLNWGEHEWVMAINNHAFYTD